ncbi:DUF4832 domain-containing protein [Maribacter sp. 2-571]|uniref:DUF4832 domain-containing protein n=1 Tax=Maribacter sp. 2-571 TaxID=3417569 RepID=UPI003D34DDDB
MLLRGAFILLFLFYGCNTDSDLLRELPPADERVPIEEKEEEGSDDENEGEDAEDVEDGEDAEGADADGDGEQTDDDDAANDDEGQQGEDDTDLVYRTFAFEESFEDFPNPERGFYRSSKTFGSAYNPLTTSELRTYREGARNSNANFSVFSTLIHRQFVLDTFLDAPLSANFLSQFENDLRTVREGGAKIILRFSYTISPKSGNCEQAAICPPYGDATKARVLEHIAQLGPLLRSYADVIATVQMGFIGIWGENYYTDHFGDASANGEERRLLDENWQDRIAVLRALLQNTDSETMVQVRYPQLKQRYVHGVSAPTTIGGMSGSQAFSGADVARIGFHNDCFLSSEDDFGTYFDYGNTANSARRDVGNLKNYVADDSRYVMVGGETCADGYSENDCDPTGSTLSEMDRLNYTYINADFDTDVTNDWENGGCMDEIKRRLGYRYWLRSITIPEAVGTEGSWNLGLDMANVGFTTLTKARPLVLVLRGVNSRTEYYVDLKLDLRTVRDRRQFEQEIDLFGAVPAGTYELLLHLPDNRSSIAQDARYAIRLANTFAWEDQTGYNDLQTTLFVE